MERKKYLIALAGGSGTRMKSGMPKQFLELNGMPLLMRTILCFSNFDSEIEIIVALPKDHIHFWQDLCKKHNFTIHHKIVEGGSERFFSVRNALAQVSEDTELIGIHVGKFTKNVMLVFSCVMLLLVGAVFVFSPASMLGGRSYCSAKSIRY